MNDQLIKKIKFADKIATKSKDPSTKVGAVFYHEHQTHPISFGYNGMPRGLDDFNVERNERPEKYQWYEHAERNAIYNVARPLLENRVVFLTHFPNMESARAIVSCGIKRVVSDIRTVIKDENYSRVIALFSETNVVLTLLDPTTHAETFEIYLEKKINVENMEAFRKEYSNLDKDMYYLSVVKEYSESESEFVTPEEQSAALFLDEKSHNPITAGVYGPPTNLIANKSALLRKDLFYQEAVKNAVYNIVRDKLRNSIVNVSWCPCHRCALGIVSVESRKVQTRKLNFNNAADLRWKEEFEKSEQIFNIANTEVVYVDMEK